MAIVEFTFNEKYIPVDAINLKEGVSDAMQMWTWNTHVGLCIRDREENGYSDSDFYMTVWNFEKNEPEEICYASTRGWTYPAMSSKVDATPEVLELYKNWMAALNERIRLEAIETEKKTVRKFKEVIVVRGRKVEKGLTGRVFWIGENRWGRTVGIETSSGQRQFTSINNVEVV